MQRPCFVFFVLFAILFSFPCIKAQKDIQADTIASLEAATNECKVVQDYCYGIDAQNVLFKGYLVSHGIVTIAAVIHEAALGLHAQNETNPFDDPDDVVDDLHEFAGVLQGLLTVVSANQAVFVGAGYKTDFTDNMGFLVGKLDFLVDELAITMPKSWRETVNNVKYSLDKAVENSIKAFVQVA